MNKSLAGLLDVPVPKTEPKKERAPYPKRNVGSSKAEAERLGLPRYISETPCRVCGSCIRYLSSRGCAACALSRARYRHFKRQPVDWVA